MADDPLLYVAMGVLGSLLFCLAVAMLIDICRGGSNGR